MDYVLIVFRSITAANRAKKLAEKEIGYAQVVQLPQNLGIKGCNYCLKIKHTDYERMISLSQKYDLKVRGSFVEKDMGIKKEYVEL